LQDVNIMDRTMRMYVNLFIKEFFNCHILCKNNDKYLYGRMGKRYFVIFVV
jgi:hypothetical protein